MSAKPVGRPRSGGPPVSFKIRAGEMSQSPQTRDRSRSPHNRPPRPASPNRPIASKDPKFLKSRVFVANVASDRTSEEQLRTMFEEHGNIIDIMVHQNGYGFVQYETEEEGRRAVELVSGKVLNGKNLKCNMAAERNKRAARGGGGKGPPGDQRYGGEHGPDEDYGPPFSNHHGRLPLLPSPMDGHPPRDMPPPPRDMPPPPQDLPPPPRDHPPHPRDCPPHPRDLPPPLPRDLPPPPRDPYFDEAFGPPVDPFFDRFPDDPYRPPYKYDPYSRLHEPHPPRRPSGVDCQIIIMEPAIRPYAEMIERRLKSIRLLTKVLVIHEDFAIRQQLEVATRRSCLFGIVINSQNEIHQSLTLNILQGIAQEHRNMPLDDAFSLIARSFEKFIHEEKEKLASGAISKERTAFVPPSKEVVYLLHLVADNQQVTVEELDKIMKYLQERKDKIITANVTPALQQQFEQQQKQIEELKQKLDEQQQQQQHKELENKILSIMNGPVPAPGPPMPMPRQIPPTGRPPLLVTPGMRYANPSMHASTSQGKPSKSAGSSSALIDFDSPTVQKALDNLIQTGPTLLKNISPGGFTAAPPTKRPPY